MIGVIIPIYNRGNLLRDTLDSLALQTMKRFVTIVVDDGSEEDISLITKQYEDKLHLVYIKKEKNEGPGPARQKGIDWAISRNLEAVTFLDADDLFFPQTVGRLTYELNHTLADVVSSEILMNDGQISTKIEAENKTWMHGKIYRLNFLKRIDLRFGLEPRTNEDLSFNLPAMYYSKTYLIQEPLYLWRRHPGSLTTTQDSVKEIAGKDFISAIYFATVKYTDDNAYIKYMFPNIISMYNYYQMVLARGEEVPEKVDERIKELFTIPYVKKILFDPAFFNFYKENLHQSHYENKKTLWFKETFKQWLDRFVEE